MTDQTTTPTQGVTITSTQIPATLGQAVIPTITDTASLTTQATQAVVSEARYASAQEALAPIRTPYPSQTPSLLLSRQYKVAEFDFVPSFTNQSISFPGALFSQQVLAGAMLSFRYWKGDIKVHVKMQSVPQQRGALLVSWLPCTNKVVTSKLVASGNHATIMNVSTSDTATFVIPYLSPKAWLTYPQYTDSDHSSLYFNTLVPLSAPTGISNVVKISVYASIEHPEVAGFVHSDEAQSALQPVKKVISTVNPMLKAITDVAASLEPALGVLNLLDKPEAAIKPQYVIESGVRATDWLTEADASYFPMSLKERPYLSNTVDLFPLGKSSDSFVTLASNPMLCFQQEVTAAAGRIEYPVNPCVPAFDGAEWGPDYLYHFTRYATYWRGGIRFFMHFCCDQFTSCRFRVGISYKAWNSNWADSGDVPSSVVDVHGSTYYAVTVPYLQDEYWQKVVVPFSGTSGYFPKLIIEALETPVGATAPAQPKITISLFRAAAPDFQLAEPGHNVPTVEPSAKKTKLVSKNKSDKAQCSIEGAFSKSFANIVPGSMLTMEKGMCMPEILDSPAQLCKRVLVPEGSYSSIYGYDEPNTMPHFYLNLTAQVFVFWRGSRRVQMQNELESTSWDITSGVLVPNPVSPSYQWDLTAAQTLGVTLPYFSTVPYRVNTDYQYTGRPFTASVTWFSNATPGVSFRFSAGDDLVCGHLVAPEYQVSPPS